MFDYYDVILWMLFAVIGAACTGLHYHYKDEARKTAFENGYIQAQREEDIRCASLSAYRRICPHDQTEAIP